jgi:uncharacterized protein YjbI with pentapeptide repeats
VAPPPTPRPPALPADLTGPDDAAARPLADELVIEEATLESADLREQRARGVAIRAARLRMVALAGAELDALELTDVVLDASDLANLRAPRSGWRRVAARHCRMTGLTLTAGRWRDVVVRDCRIDLASFAGARLERVSFEDCVLRGADFLEAELDAVRFSGCDLSEADLRGARLRRCELRDNRLEQLRGVEALRGAALRWSDIVGGAPLWAQALGIEVLDEG